MTDPRGEGVIASGPAPAADDHAELVRLGARLRVLRLRAGLSQQDVADRSGVHRVSLSRYERGLSDFGVSYLCRFAAALGVTLQELFVEQQATTGSTKQMNGASRG